MITQMSVVNITGPRDDIDRMSDQYLSKYDFHPINTLKELSGIETLRPYTSANPYEPYEARIDELLHLTDVHEDQELHVQQRISFAAVKDLVETIESDLSDERQSLQKVNDDYDEAKKRYALYEPFSGIDYRLDEILEMQMIKFRFGRFTTDNYRKFIKYIDDNVPSIFVKSKEEDGYVYGVYFTPVDARQRVDALYYSLAWERIYLPEATGQLEAIVQEAKAHLEATAKSKAAIESHMRSLILPIASELINAKARLQQLSHAWGLRKYAAITRDEFAQKETRYLIIGWMATNDALALAEDVKDDDDVTVIIEDDKDNQQLKPPTKLRNNFFVRPFEMITNMYGTPNYNEWDPTGLVAITYSILFGAMFGDLGHGILLTAVGLMGYLFPKLNMAKMFVPVGVCSMIFGTLYGSFFGFEDLIPTLWVKPAEAMTTVPFFGTLNTVFVVSVAFGMFLILATMVINVWERLKNGETWDAVFDKNGIMGFVFYGLLVFIMVMYMMGLAIPSAGLLGAIVLISLLLVAFKEPIVKHIEHQEKTGEEDGLVMSLVTIFFETFETLLTYFSNTISFVRVGAFAISHGIMMSVVLMFAGVESGNVNWLVLTLGNLFVVGFEGLVVFIQVLRLEFYELFSHFFKGDGIAFKSIWSD